MTVRAGFYVAGGREQGTGHIYRCRALAEKMGAPSIFLIDEGNPGLLEICGTLGLEVEQLSGGTGAQRAEALRSRAEARNLDVVVLDLFEVERTYLERLKDSLGNLPLVALDDYAIQWPIPDVVIKPHLVEEWYAPESNWRGTLLLTGTDYWVLRPSLQRLAARKRPVRREGSRVLVTLGGSDPRGLSVKVARELAPLSRIERLQIVCGPGFAARAEVEAAVRNEAEPGRVEILTTPEDFDLLMFSCDLAVTGGGYTVYELAALGTPMVILPWVRHQLGHARALGSRGAAEVRDMTDGSAPAGLNEFVDDLLEDRQRRSAMSMAGRATVDGKGTDRVVDVIEEVV